MSNYNPYRKYCRSWWFFWLNLPRDIWFFLRKLRAYAPLLWEDRDYDFNDGLRTLRFKLTRLRKHLEGHMVLAHAEDRVAELARVDVLLRNVLEGDPDDEWSLHYDQWHSCIKGFKDCKNLREHKRALKLSWERERRNWRSLWRYIEKYARGWWD